MHHDVSQWLATTFVAARTHRQWQERPVGADLLGRIYDTARFGPTAYNANPMRVLFLTSESAKQAIAPALTEGNKRAVLAPVIAVFAIDDNFVQHLGRLAPRLDAAAEFGGHPELKQTTASRSATLQAAYFMVVARAMGLDCGPMSGFDNGLVDQTFFAGTAWRSNFLCALGYGVAESLRPRAERLSFNQACKVI